MPASIALTHGLDTPQPPRRADTKSAATTSTTTIAAAARFDTTTDAFATHKSLLAHPERIPSAGLPSSHGHDTLLHANGAGTHKMGPAANARLVAALAARDRAELAAAADVANALEARLTDPEGIYAAGLASRHGGDTFLVAGWADAALTRGASGADCIATACGMGEGEAGGGCRRVGKDEKG